MSKCRSSFEERDRDMPTLFLDLDNTLIYSHRHRLNTPVRVAEYLNGKEQSYITERTYRYLRARKDLRIVPVTTRTLPQFLRVEALLNELRCTVSLICNGAILLCGGAVDAAWTEESLRLSEEERTELPAAIRWLESRCGKGKTHVVSELFVYAGTDSPADTARELEQIVDTGKTDVLCDARKVYCIPRTLNKGTALRRFVLRYGVSHAIAAGDSEFDVPMLNLGEYAIVPPDLADKVRGGRKIIVDGKQCFSDSICDCLEKLSEEHRLDENGDAVWNNP